MLLRLNDWIARALLAAAALLAFLLCFLVCADVIGRVVFNSPVKGTPEIVSGSIVMILWLQAAYAIRSGGMIWVDAVHVYLPAPVKRACDLFGALLGVAFFSLIVWGSVEPAHYAWVSGEFEGEGALRVPVWPARFLVVLGSFLAAFNYLLLALERARSLVSGAPPAPPAGPALDERVA
ncbi:MAG: TRAP transporter small permease [Burkholderiales bacterium]|nr:TRAP transporter small permease [Burkholderiales bacterium]